MSLTTRPSTSVRRKSRPAVAEGQFFVIEAQEVEDGGVKVVHVDFVLDGFVAEFIGGAVGEAGFDAAAGEPGGEAEGVVVAAGAIFFGVGGAAKLAAPPDEGVFEEAALLEIGEEAGDGLIDGAGVVERVLGDWNADPRRGWRCRRRR